MRILKSSILACLAGACLSASCAVSADTSEWQVLFDGQNLDAWRGYQSEAIPPGWRIEGDMLAFANGKGDLVTRDTYSDFELELEWKISPRGNSGIFYLAVLSDRPIYHSAPEMQILDDEAHRDGGNRLTSAGSNYALHPAPAGAVRPVGEWNDVRIVLKDRRVSHWLNGVMTADYTLGSPEWNELVAGSKFAAWPEYGQALSGHIGLQDHGDPVWFRNIRIRRLD
jgi:hypothetical protein